MNDDGEMKCNCTDGKHICEGCKKELTQEDAETVECVNGYCYCAACSPQEDQAE